VTGVLRLRDTLTIHYVGVVPYCMALEPGKSLPYVWNAFTANWLETNLGALGASCIAVVVLGRVLEPAMGRGLHSFRFQLNLSSSVHRVTQPNS